MSQTSVLYLVIGGLVVLALAMAWIVRRLARSIDAVIAADVQDFVSTFPGRCPICSYDRVGRAQGMDLGPLPEHNCPEGRSK